MSEMKFEIVMFVIILIELFIIGLEKSITAVKMGVIVYFSVIGALFIWFIFYTIYYCYRYHEAGCWCLVPKFKLIGDRTHGSVAKTSGSVRQD